MAFRDLFRGGDGFIPKHRDNLFFNLDGGVGPDSAKSRSSTFSMTWNREDDVMLVQYCLKKTADNPQSFKHPFFPPKSRPVMKIDGKFGPITQAWIEKFQNHLHEPLKFTVLRDGLVDRILRGQPTSGRGFLLTHMALNIALGKVMGEARWDTWWKDDIEVPGLLRNAVRDPATFF